MQGLLAAVDDAHPDSAVDETWLHLNEELPSWLVALHKGESGGVTLPDDVTDALRHALELEQQAAIRFDFRREDNGYRERSQALSGEFDADTRARILELTTELGLVRPSQPEWTEHDRTLILGGAHRSPLQRATYAAHLESAGYQLGEPYFLGSPRLLMDQPDERARTADYAPGAVDEFDLMIAGAREAFGFSSEDVGFLCGCSTVEMICPQWPWRDTAAAAQTPPRFTHERAAILDRAAGAPGTVLSASTGRPPYRPDTTDTLALWARYAHPAAGERLLVVTTQVFVPFQTFDSLKRLYLAHGVEIDTVGYGADWSGREETPELLLQETLSGIRSARRLLVEAAQALAA
ncbi:MAG: hypothetical protein QOE23_686 [Pseudonocardiales bacterium]|jgi:hypothetical protein|nr:hypothetical protein [Pseudonocardiales bacterium]